MRERRCVYLRTRQTYVYIVYWTHNLAGRTFVFLRLLACHSVSWGRPEDSGQNVDFKQTAGVSECWLSFLLPVWCLLSKISFERFRKKKYENVHLQKFFFCSVEKIFVCESERQPGVCVFSASSQILLTKWNFWYFLSMVELRGQHANPPIPYHKPSTTISQESCRNFRLGQLYQTSDFRDFRGIQLERLQTNLVKEYQIVLVSYNLSPKISRCFSNNLWNLIHCRSAVSAQLLLFEKVSLVAVWVNTGFVQKTFFVAFTEDEGVLRNVWSDHRTWTTVPVLSLIKTASSCVVQIV